jgi:cysteine desulfurase
MKTYLDNNATTKMAPEVLEAMLPYLREKYGNPSSFHSFGNDLMDAVEDARGKVADLIGASPEEIVFTSGGTESDNMALEGVLRINPLKPDLVTSKIEHPAVLRVAERLQEQGTAVSYSTMDRKGRFDLKGFSDSVSPRTGLASLMMANNETGIVLPIKEAAEITSDSGALFHTDAVQAAGKMSIDVKEMNVDLLSLSAHKFHGPKGVGALFIRKGIDLPPLTLGGHQEQGLRPGTYNVPGIVGMGRAAQLALEHVKNDSGSIQALRSRMENSILEACPGAEVVGLKAERLPNTSSILFGGVESEAILTLLDIEGICASSGSACSTGESSPSHVLLSMEIGAREANTAIRFSLSRYSSEDDIDHLMAVLPGIIEKLRSISPYSD